MKILLEPIYFFQRWPFEIYATRAYFNIPSLSLLQIAAHFPKITEVVDGIQDPSITPKKLFKILQKYNSIDCLIGLGAHSSVSGINTFYTLKMIKEYAPEATVFMGGYHATFFDRFWVRLGADIVFRGEADKSYPNFVNEFKTYLESDTKQFNIESLKGCTVSREWVNNIKTRIVQDVNNKQNTTKNKIVKFDIKKVFNTSLVVHSESPLIMEDIELIRNLDEIPFPIRLNKSLPTHYLPFDGKGYASAIETARGCPYICEFCSTARMWKGKQRYKSAERIIEELKMCQKIGISKFVFVDESWGVNYNETMKFLNKLQQSNLKISVQARVDTIINHPDLFILGAKCGIKAAMVGYESLSQTILDKSKKKTKVDMFYKTRDILHQAGIMIFGFFLIGLPGETKQQTLLTLSHMYSLSDVPFLQQYVPYFQGAYKKAAQNQPNALGYKTDLPKISFFILDTQFIHQMFSDPEDIAHIKSINYNIRAKDRILYILNPKRIFELLFARNEIERTRRVYMRNFYLSLIKNIIKFHPRKLLNSIRGYRNA